MTKAAKAPAKGAKKDGKKEALAGAPQTGTLPLKGEKTGTTMALDNSKPIKVEIPVDVTNKARLFAQAKDRMDTYKDQVVTHGDELLDLMLKNALPADVRIRVDTDRGVRFISYKDTGVTLVVERAQSAPPKEEKKPEPKKPEAKKDDKAAKATDKKPETAGAKK